MNGLILKGLVLGLGVGSLGLMINGIYHQDWWAGFGLVLAMTSVMCWLSIFPAKP